MSDPTVRRNSLDDAGHGNQSGGLTRQTWLKRLLSITFVGWLVSIFYPVVRFLIPPPLGESNVTSMKAGNVGDIWENPWQILQLGRTPVILFKDSEAQYRALEATCSHLACIVQYRSDDNSIWCACHNGIFDPAGNVISGPPPAPLESYTVDITDSGEIWVSRETT